MTDPSQVQNQSRWQSLDLLKHEGFVLAMASVAMYVAAFAWQRG